MSHDIPSLSDSREDAALAVRAVDGEMESYRIPISTKLGLMVSQSTSKALMYIGDQIGNLADAIREGNRS